MDEEPLLDLVIRQLPPGTRRELGIPGLTLARDGSVRFRLDPRQAFERAARVTRAHSGDLRLAVSQRYRPHDEMELLKDELVTQPETSLADHLRTQLGFADWQETRPHWQRTYQRQHPEKTRTLPLSHSAIIAAQRLARNMAESTGTACYLWRSSDTLTCANNPAPSGRLFSVTPDGAWSAHSGEYTRPIPMAPAPWDLVPGWGVSARLAARDLGTGAVGAVRSGEPEAPPAARPAPAPDQNARRRR